VNISERGSRNLKPVENVVTELHFRKCGTSTTFSIGFQYFKTQFKTLRFPMLFERSEECCSSQWNSMLFEIAAVDSHGRVLFRARDHGRGRPWADVAGRGRPSTAVDSPGRWTAVAEDGRGRRRVVEDGRGRVLFHARDHGRGRPWADVAGRGRPWTAVVGGWLWPRTAVGGGGWSRTAVDGFCSVHGTTPVIGRGRPSAVAGDNSRGRVRWWPGLPGAGRGRSFVSAGSRDGGPTDLPRVDPGRPGIRRVRGEPGSERTRSEPGSERT